MGTRFRPRDTPGESPADVFGQYGVAKWQVGTSPTVCFAITGQLIQEVGNRLVRHARPYRKGAKLDSTGAIEEVFELTAVFNNTIREPGLEENTRAAYPFMLREMVQSFSFQETGTLTLPTIGRIRARAERCKRIEDSAQRQEGTLQLTFVEDNEDALAQATFALPSVRASVVKQASQTKFTADRAGAHDPDLLSLFQAALEIEALLLAPGRSLADLQSKVTASQRALARVMRAQEQFADDVGGTANEPRGSEFFRNLIRMLDTQARAADEKFASRPRIKAFVVDVDQTSIYAVASRLKQDAGELLDLNSERVADPFDLTRGQVIRVFETAAR